MREKEADRSIAPFNMKIEPMSLIWDDWMALVKEGKTASHAARIHGPPDQFHSSNRLDLTVSFKCVYQNVSFRDTWINFHLHLPGFLLFRLPLFIVKVSQASAQREAATVRLVIRMIIIIFIIMKIIIFRVTRVASLTSALRLFAW